MLASCRLLLCLVYGALSSELTRGFVISTSDLAPILCLSLENGLCEPRLVCTSSDATSPHSREYKFCKFCNRVKLRAQWGTGS